MTPGSRALIIWTFLYSFAPKILAIWQDPLGWREFPDGSDLQHFVTRPEFKAPRYQVAKHHPDAIQPGYWFITPYTKLGVPPKTGQKDYLSCMTGAHIYDGDGELVWAGSCTYSNRNVFSLRPVRVNGSDFLTFYLPRDNSVMSRADDRVPHGVILDNTFTEVSRHAPYGTGLDGHEFYLMPDGRTALMSTRKSIDIDATEYGLKGRGNRQRRVISTGFQDLDLATQRPIFDWDPLKNGISLGESCDEVGRANQAPKDGWDFMHTNSVHKSADGNYLISARHLSMLFMVSGIDGHVIWRLGGCSGQSDFKMEEGLAFAWQHHARIRKENETHTILSVFDNASEDADRGEPRGHAPPVGKIIILDHEQKTAKVLRRFDCPNQSHQTPALGSMVLLGDDPERAGVFINWAFQGYVSEYDGDGRLVLEAKFVSDRKRTMRAYKAPFVSNPSVEELILRILPMSYSDDTYASAFYVSWNGATEVREWKFFGSKTGGDDDDWEQLATIPKNGFETSWVTPNVVGYAFAVAVDANGKSLGRSRVASLRAQYDPGFTIGQPALTNHPSAYSTLQQAVSNDPPSLWESAQMARIISDDSAYQFAQLVFVVFLAGVAGLSAFSILRLLFRKMSGCRRFVRLGSTDESKTYS